MENLARMLSALLSHFFDDEEKHRASQSVAACAPLHPHQKFQRLCSRIENNDERLRSVEFRNEAVDLGTLAKALAKNTHVLDLELVQSIMMIRTPDDDGDEETSRRRNDGIQAFFLDGIRHNQSLRSLNLSENPFGDAGARLIQKAVQHHPTLEKLRLSRCQLGNEGIRILAVSRFAFAQNHLKELDVSCNHLTDGVALCRILQQNQTLVRLDVSCNDLRDSGLTSLVSNGFGSLEALTLNNNHIGSQGADALGKALAMPCCSLAELRFHQNPINDTGLLFLANGLKTNTSLKRLILTRCSIGDGGAASVARALQTNLNSSLTELHLGSNDVGNQGTLALLGTSLRRLELPQNDIQGGQDLVQALSKNCTLEWLDIHLNKVKVRHGRAIHFWTRFNATGGHRLLLCQEQHSVPIAIWAHVLGNASDHSDILYHIFTHKPELCQN